MLFICAFIFTAQLNTVERRHGAERAGLAAQESQQERNGQAGGTLSTTLEDAAQRACVSRFLPGFQVSRDVDRFG